MRAAYDKGDAEAAIKEQNWKFTVDAIFSKCVSHLFVVMHLVLFRMQDAPVITPCVGAIDTGVLRPNVPRTERLVALRWATLAPPASLSTSRFTMT